MWGWLSSITSGIETIWQKISLIPGVILDGLQDFFSEVSGWLSNIWDAITNIPDLILDGIKEIFIPDTEEIEASVDSFLDQLEMKFNFDTDFFTNFMTGEQPVTDVYEDYNIPGVGTFTLKFFDTEFFYDGVKKL